MDGTVVDVRRPVVVKVIMTAGFRQQLLTEVRDAIAQVERNLKLIETQSTNLPPDTALERDKLVSTRAQMEWRIREIEGVDDGAELPYRTFDGTVSIRCGDNFLKKMGECEIVLKDWEVVDIRGQ